jgi:membrane protease YdiL (CAAX protease family)
MKSDLPPPTGNWTTLCLLWKAARTRAAGRQKRQAELMKRKTGSSSDTLGGLAMIFIILMMGFVHGSLGWMLTESLETASIMAEESESGLLATGSSRDLFEQARRYQTQAVELEAKIAMAEVEERATQKPALHLKNLRRSLETTNGAYRSSLNSFFEVAARWRERELGGSREKHLELLKAHFQKHGEAGFKRPASYTQPSLSKPQTIPASYWPFVGFVLLWWMVMIVFQGEGLELDIQRRRHPMWEWLLSHPVRPVAAFAAEMLAPLMANPIYFSAPIFWWVVLGKVFGLEAGLLGALLIGLPFAVAASCLNKALEIAALLRLSARNRGAVLGIMSWAGYAAMMLPLFMLNARSLKIWLVTTLGELSAWVPTWPARALVIGWGAQPVLWQVVVSGVLLAGAICLASGWLAWWGTAHGLQSGGAGAPTQPRLLEADFGPRWLAGNALYRKELLWFWRDKSAIVQVVLIPLTIGAFQAFNLRSVVELAGTHWNALCGLAIICGTYFLLVLGPRSLASEGGALWIALTWPRGLEDLLKAKARLWWIVANVIVGIILAAAVFIFPADAWRIALVAAGWVVFSHSLAEKSVTLVMAPSSSGEIEHPPAGRQWAAMLGTLAFGSGVLMQAWHSAIIGVVFSSLTAAAMWQNLRARLPHLFDPWSEKLPPAPTLMHAMIGIAVMVEVVGLVSGIAIAAGGASDLWMARSIVYGVVGLLAWWIMHGFLGGHGVKARDIWHWPGRGDHIPASVLGGGAALAGIVLAGGALLYSLLLEALPFTRDYMQELAKISAGFEKQIGWQILLAVGFAPIAEEYFFRGLLYRALDREWGGMKALIGSAAFFAIYHPPMAWLPVFAVGLVNAWLFKTGGRLWPCVLLHMSYNAVVVGFQ